MKKQIESNKGLITNAGKQNYQLMQEYGRLKTENEELKGIRDRNFLHALEEQKRADKLSKTLTEIKEIAEEKAKVNDWLALEVLQKINEVE